jgi:2-iminoacetate synthase
LGEELCLEDAGVLLKLDLQLDADLVGEIVGLARRRKNQLFNGKVYLVVPVYVSSICREDCLYCNYRKSNHTCDIERIRLSMTELVDEISYLATKGYRAVELVYSSDPKLGCQDVARQIEATRRTLEEFGGGLVGLNGPSYDVGEYKLLREAGLGFAVSWQETYSEERYHVLHPGDSIKANYAYRLRTQERMIQAGLTCIGLGVLSGLSEWRLDWYLLMGHMREIVSHYPTLENQMIAGIPRLKKAAGAALQTSQYTPNDTEFLLALSILNLLYPLALPFVNTRESFGFCAEAAKGGGCLMTLDCHTLPGGYRDTKKGYQFPTYSFSIETHMDKLVKHGLHPVAEWDFLEALVQ